MNNTSRLLLLDKYKAMKILTLCRQDLEFLNQSKEKETSRCLEAELQAVESGLETHKGNFKSERDRFWMIDQKLREDWTKMKMTRFRTRKVLAKDSRTIISLWKLLKTNKSLAISLKENRWLLQATIDLQLMRCLMIWMETLTDLQVDKKNLLAL